MNKSTHSYAILWQLNDATTGRFPRLKPPFPLALSSLAKLGLGPGDSDPATDRRLHALSDPTLALLARLCLRCRASAAAKAKLEALHKKCLDLLTMPGQADAALPELADMASFILDDVGALDPDGPAEPQPYVPFLLSMLRGWNPDRAALPNWTWMAIDGHPGLKRYLRDYRIDFISPWAYLTHRVTVKAIREAWPLYAVYADLGMTCEEAERLLHAFKQIYEQAKSDYRTRTGKRCGWSPDPAFFLEVDPATAAQKTMARLQAIVRVVKNLKIGPPLGSIDGIGDDIPSDQVSGADELPERAALWAPMRRVRDEAISFPPAYKPAAQRLRENGERLLCVCRGQAAGRSIDAEAPELQRSQRQIACDCHTSQPTVSRDQDALTEWAQEIAVVTAGRLRGTPGFETLGSTVADLERVIAAVANSLLVPLRLGEDAPLCQAIDLHLHN